MTQDTRCCGTGTCLIDTNGRCWCGQQWDGEQMRRPEQQPNATATVIDPQDTQANTTDAEGHAT